MSMEKGFLLDSYSAHLWGSYGTKYWMGETAKTGARINTGSRCTWIYNLFAPSIANVCSIRFLLKKI